jgi:hypothetical protein
VGGCVCAQPGSCLSPITSANQVQFLLARGPAGSEMAVADRSCLASVHSRTVRLHYLVLCGLHNFSPPHGLLQNCRNQHQKRLEALATACEGAIELRFNLKRVGFIQARERWGLPGRMGWQWTLFQPHEGQCITQAPFVQTQQSRPCCTSCTSLARRGSPASFHPRHRCTRCGRTACELPTGGDCLRCMPSLSGHLA